MKGFKIVVAFWLATAAFCGLQIVFGPTGLVETSRLQKQSQKLEARLEALRHDNATLTQRYEALLSRPEAIRLEARALGWFEADESPVKTLDGGVFFLPSDAPDLSKVPSLPVIDPGISVFFRLAWPVLFSTFWTILFLVDRLRSKLRRLEAGRGALVPFGFFPSETRLDFFRK